MSAGLAMPEERAFERSYRRHVGDVYRYALGVLSDPLDAEEVTRATFLNAYRSVCLGGRRPELNALLRIAHEVCRRRGGHPRISDAELAAAQPADFDCSVAELAISRHLDDRLSRGERGLLRRHLHGCADCKSFVRSLLAQRTALRELASIPLPPALRSFQGWKQDRKFLAHPASS